MINFFKEQFDAMRRAANGNKEEIEKAEKAQRKIDLEEHEITAKNYKQAEPEDDNAPESWITRHEKRQDESGDRFFGRHGSSK